MRDANCPSLWALTPRERQHRRSNLRMIMLSDRPERLLPELLVVRTKSVVAASAVSSPAPPGCGQATTRSFMTRAPNETTSDATCAEGRR